MYPDTCSIMRKSYRNKPQNSFLSYHSNIITWKSQKNDTLKFWEKLEEYPTMFFDLYMIIHILYLLYYA